MHARLLPCVDLLVLRVAFRLQLHAPTLPRLRGCLADLILRFLQLRQLLGDNAEANRLCNELKIIFRTLQLLHQAEVASAEYRQCAAASDNLVQMAPTGVGLWNGSQYVSAEQHTSELAWGKVPTASAVPEEPESKAQQLLRCTTL